MEFGPHRSDLFLNNLAREAIDIDAPLAKNPDSMMSVEYSAIRPGFEAVSLAD